MHISVTGAPSCWSPRCMLSGCPNQWGNWCTTSHDWCCWYSYPSFIFSFVDRLGLFSFATWTLILTSRSSTKLLMSSLRCRSSSPFVHPDPSLTCILLNYKTNTCKFISPTWSCWSLNTKIQTKWANGPFSLQSPPFWCLMTTWPK